MYDATKNTAFSSTYAREIAFDDERWEERLYNPDARTFVAVDAEHRRVLSSVTLIGPRPVPEDIQCASLSTTSGEPPLHWQINAVYTAPEARRRGIGMAVITAAVRLAIEQAAGQGRGCLLTILTDEVNTMAMGLYQKAGFAVSNLTTDGDLQLVRFLPLERSGARP